MRVCFRGRSFKLLVAIHHNITLAVRVQVSRSFALCASECVSFVSRRMFLLRLSEFVRQLFAHHGV